MGIDRNKGNSRDRGKDRLDRRLASLTDGHAKIETAATLKHRIARAVNRPSVYRYGVIETRSGDHLPCIVRDVTTRGAKVTLESIAVLPETAVLVINQSGLRKRVHIVWQKDHEAGLSFDGA